MNWSTPGLPVHHQLPESTQTHVHWVSNAIQPSHPLSSPSPPVFNLYQHQGLFQWVSSSHQLTKVLELQLQSFQWIFRINPYLNNTCLGPGVVAELCMLWKYNRGFLWKWRFHRLTRLKYIALYHLPFSIRGRNTTCIIINIWQKKIHKIKITISLKFQNEYCFVWAPFLQFKCSLHIHYGI